MGPANRPLQECPNSYALRVFAIILLSVSVLTACVTDVPIDEWAVARAAYNAAKDAESARYVPAIWFNGEQSYREAQRAYKERRFDEARELFVEAKVLCEQAENAARLARQQSGEIVP
jgi:hypothetical protein